METRSNHILVGGVVLGLLVMLVVFVLWIAQLSGGSEKKYDIFFKSSVDGLAKGSSGHLQRRAERQDRNHRANAQITAIRACPN